MEVSVVKPAELGLSEEKQWREFQSLYPVGAHPNYSLTYVRAVCRSDDNGRVAIAEDSGGIRAFIPYTKENGGVAETLGGGQTGVDGLISSNEPIDLRQVVRRARLRGWRFTYAPAGQTPVDPYRYQGDYHVREVHVTDLRDGYDGYLQSLPKKTRAGIARRRRGLEREIGPVSLEWNSDDPANRNLLLEWKSAQFPYVRRWLSDPSHRTMVEELANSENEDCSGVTSVLYAGAKPVAVSLNLRAGGMLAGWFIGYDPEYSRFSPGTMLWLGLSEEAARRGVEIVDFGYGDDKQKVEFGNASYPVSGGAVWASRLESAARSVYRRARYRD
jgi:CelD/BcsL family acetyltransferase involved in cellulose biosynthesis